MHNSCPNIMKLDLLTDHINEVKRYVEIFDELHDQTKSVVIPSIANSAWISSLPKIHKPTFAASTVLFLM